jgi:hypothetical protein
MLGSPPSPLWCTSGEGGIVVAFLFSYNGGIHVYHPFCIINLQQLTSKLESPSCIKFTGPS